MSLRSFSQEPVYLAVFVFLFCLGNEHIPLTCTLLGLFLWWKRTHDRSFVLVAMIFLLCVIPRYSSAFPDCFQGRVVSVHSSYAMVQSGRQKVILYTDEPLLLDATIRYETEFSRITSGSSFFGFSFEKYCHQNDIFYAGKAEKIHYEDYGHSLRQKLQKRIMQEEDEQTRAMLYKTILNISDYENNEEWLNSYGFSLSGVLILLDKVTSRFLDRKKRKILSAVAEIFLCILYVCPLTVLIRLVFDILSLTGMDEYEKTGFSLVFIMILDPSCIYGFTFTVIAVVRLGNLFFREKPFFMKSCLLILESLTFQMINPIRAFIFPFLLSYMGLLWISSLICLLGGLSFLENLCAFGNGIYELISICNMPGSIKGAGTFFFLLLVFSLRRNRHFWKKVYVLILVFQFTGLFHPFMELSFINVGQGDAILLKGPLLSSSILIDTGKPQAEKALTSFLYGKGIRKLDRLILSHGDSDHTGNRDQIIEKWKPETVTETHEQCTVTGPFTIYDLNSLKEEDENTSSIMNYFSMNGLKVLLCGDGTQKSEEEILKRYGNLKVDILKAGHHGSATSSSEKFLDRIRPELVLFSAGSPKLYHHPSSIVIERLQKRHIPYMNTYERGDITILCLPFCNLLITSDGSITFLS